MLETRFIEDEPEKTIDIPFQDTPKYLQQKEKLDAFWGGHTSCHTGYQLFHHRMVKLQRPVTIAQLGCGGAYELLELKAFLDKHTITAKLIGIDANAANIAFATKNFTGTDVNWIVGEYDDVKWLNGQKPDIIFSSLYCHNFTSEQLIYHLHWLKENSQTGFFISDLKRNKFAYGLFKLYALFFVRNKILRKKTLDAIKNGFTKEEWKHLLNKAGIRRFKIKETFANRLLIYVKQDKDNL
jgi:hypothetical protein